MGESLTCGDLAGIETGETRIGERRLLRRARAELACMLGSKAPSANNGFVADAMWNTVSRVTGVFAWMSANPKLPW